MEKAANIILFICSQFGLDLKSNQNGSISVVKGDEEFILNIISKDYNVNIFRETEPDGAGYSIIERV